ncbi:UbiB family protein [Komagataella phaffii CBS 7435]|uniref:UbiB family protein n=1 Tax=Komagataella phaffii (strain ATCC 76273 / CBS 7435 / CECT 11047 / NRRL Y-11430 / Wegner 21-1) TaxID=981350 RepID=F2QRK1_KOMPC|nr:Hypothetical protein BQ9382_C2-1825 [Komagataella phaffii CBS 7435]CCA38029.1 UbiB family protein [Komagataella phaffii CBS 7435]
MNRLRISLNPSRNAFRRFGLILGSSTALVYYSNQHYKNDSPLYKGLFKNDQLLSNRHLLKADKDSDTLERGLFDASMKELEEQNRKVRAQQMKRFGWLTKLKFFLVDYVWEPLVTVGRLIELTILFSPILLLRPIVWFGHRRHDRSNEKSGAILWYKYIKFSAELAGPSFIKLGQWAASRTDIFPEELCNELGKLHANARPHPLHQTKRILEKTFGLPFDHIFDHFDEVPLGCGAIAQVYRGKLNSQVLEDNKVTEDEQYFELSTTDSKGLRSATSFENHHPTNPWVAVKVIHPGVEMKVHRDLKIMNVFANIINYMPTMEWLSLPDEVEQFSILMRIQLDLRIEGINLKYFQAKFAGRESVKFPNSYMKFSGREVLVEEYMQGVSMQKLLKCKSTFGKGITKETSDKLLDAFLQMLILDNFVHADLHPGNIMVRFYQAGEHQIHPKKYSTEEEIDQLSVQLNKLSIPELEDRLETLHKEGYHPEVCFIDTGLVTELNETDRINFIELFNALSEFDGYKAGELMIERSRTPETAINKEIFALKVEKLVDRIRERTFTLGSVSIGDLLDQVLGMVRQHHVRMEGDFVTVIVAILLLEGIGRQLDPELDLFASSLPVLRKLGFKDGKMILKNKNTVSMVKVWLVFEVRQFIHASVQDIYNLVKSDGLSPNY